MARITNDTLAMEWSKHKSHWHTIYRWSRCTGVGYSEFISDCIVRDFNSIALNLQGLRKSDFRCPHFGQADLRHEDRETKEKMLCRASFNQRYIGGLGTVLDYEVPLNEVQTAGHGDIDLLCLREDELLCIEAKYFSSSESALKGLIEAFVYARLLQRNKKRILSEFNLSSTIRIRPVFLTFATAASHRQLTCLANDSSVLRMIKQLNGTLVKEEINPIELQCGVMSGDSEGSLWDRLPFRGTIKLVRFKTGIVLNSKKIELPYS